jgi:hypothetical protein
MRGLVDPTNDPGDIKGLTKDLTDAVNSKTSKQEPLEAAEDDVPAKYKGKTRAEIIAMHQNAESKLGQVGNEIGEMRSLTDRLLDLKRKEDLEQGGYTPKEITSSDILDRPTESVRDVVEDLLTAREREAQREAQLYDEETAIFNSVHPDAGAIVNQPEFLEWVKSSPVRQRTAAAAAQRDWEAADALLNEWKSLPQDRAPERGGDDSIEKARKASTESVGASSASSSSGKKYRRMDLIKLKLEQPDVYSDPQFQDEIMRAYSEGRVT